MTISREDMAAHTTAGHAQPWTQELGPDRMVWTAARIWYVALGEDDHYRPAPALLSEALNAAQDVTTLPAPEPQDVAGALHRVETALAQVAGRSPASEAGALTRKEMVAHFETGVAQPLEHDLTNRARPIALRMWYFVVDGEDFFRAAPQAIAAVLDHARAAFAEVERQDNADHLATAEAARSA